VTALAAFIGWVCYIALLLAVAWWALERRG
jgi:hypothetical protein